MGIGADGNPSPLDDRKAFGGRVTARAGGTDLVRFLRFPDLFRQLAHETAPLREPFVGNCSHSHA
jgi:hypothetical protein